MTSKQDQELSQGLTERVLGKLGFSSNPEIDLNGLQKLYFSWCRNVPFDNSRKLIHVKSGNPAPLPGGDPVDFFEHWLIHGSGGTCWSGNGALCALLSSLGFQAKRGVATMLVYPELPPNHGTVIVELENEKYVVDASILHSEPLPLADNIDTRQESPPWGVHLRKLKENYEITWTPFNHLNGLNCRIDMLSTTVNDFIDRYEATREWSPFNFELHCRKICTGSTVGVIASEKWEKNQQGQVSKESLSPNERIRVLIELMGFSEEHAGSLPADAPTPPPPWSRKAKAGGH